MIKVVYMRKNKKTKKMIIFGFLMCLLIVIIVFLAKFILDGLNKNKPDEVFKQYMSFANKKQYEKMYDLLDEKSKSENKKEDFVLRNKKIYEGIDAHDISIKINDIKKNKNNDKVINYD
ncbi:TPA: penicillin-binding transpeptidase domain-containing protein, partial [Clostridioides difficile]|nr:penicillin-binding transpeptidase domain-containing protein [Clostridioides difficile]